MIRYQLLNTLTKRTEFTVEIADYLVAESFECFLRTTKTAFPIPVDSLKFLEQAHPASGRWILVAVGLATAEYAGWQMAAKDGFGIAEVKEMFFNGLSAWGISMKAKPVGDVAPPAVPILPASSLAGCPAPPPKATPVRSEVTFLVEGSFRHTEAELSPTYQVLHHEATSPTPKLVWRPRPPTSLLSRYCVIPASRDLELLQSVPVTSSSKVVPRPGLEAQIENELKDVVESQKRMRLRAKEEKDHQKALKKKDRFDKVQKHRKALRLSKIKYPERNEKDIMRTLESRVTAPCDELRTGDVLRYRWPPEETYRRLAFENILPELEEAGLKWYKDVTLKVLN
ncbi:hypothetical protein RUND412_010413 [Rhizina undulata]